LQEAQQLRQAIRRSLDRMQEVKRDHLHPNRMMKNAYLSLF
jgi:hypothetical protein